ncbi:hypothetical protein A6A05_02590 [Magnetospirillum moscoviense]|uniref:Antitoxin n=2 Tax=Magnetospirillum moscoviense TaxID=1437059 RepID=A0A178MM35_9PROT|nr:DUF433 domain-containing protein [Alphaproteobacteria bacterium]OAN48994.1 hypothetical protein A6A05_02590 [Magnetospirillum moscoviense]
MARRRASEVIVDPNVMGGIPVIRGTRVPAHLIGRLAAQGASALEILETYPYLTLGDVNAALDYARSHPEAAL